MENMKEKEPQGIKKSPEHIPTHEEVASIFKRLTDKKYTEIRKIEDAKGLYLFDITILGDLEGETIEYSYRRGQSGMNGKLVDAIQIIYYKNNTPVGGTTVAEIVDGKWIIFV